jgi:hypothetical protein
MDNTYSDDCWSPEVRAEYEAAFPVVPVDDDDSVRPPLAYWMTVAREAGEPDELEGALARMARRE